MTALGMVGGADRSVKDLAASALGRMPMESSKSLRPNLPKTTRLIANRQFSGHSDDEPLGSSCRDFNFQIILPPLTRMSVHWSSSMQRFLTVCLCSHVPFPYSSQILGLVPARTACMTYNTAGQTSDAVRPLKNLNGVRSILALVRRRAMDRPIGGVRRGVLMLALLFLSAPIQPVSAQAPGFSGFGAPDTSVDGKPARRSELPPNRRESTGSRSTSKALKGGIRPISYENEPEEAQPKTPFQIDEPIAKVMIEGNSTIPDSEIAKHIKTRPSRPATQKQIKDDVDSLMRTRWFVSVEPKLRPSDEGLALVFRVIERPIVRRVEYKGLKKVKQKTFDAMTQLKPGSPFDISSNRECARRIEEYYHEKGFAFATVELEKGNDRDDREVVFLIHEGPKVHVTSVKFDGNQQFIDGILKTKTRTKTRILWLFGGKYDPSTIKDDKEGVKQYYHSLGYFDVAIEERLKFSEDKANLEIHYEIDEGQRYKIRNIEIAGNNVLSEEELRDMMKVNGGIHYNARDINKDVEVIKSKYGEQGRLFCRVDAVPKWTEEEGIVDLEYKIEEDKVYRVRNINVKILGDHPHTRTIWCGISRHCNPVIWRTPSRFT